MQANWSLILNVLLLIGVMVAIGRLMKARRQSLSAEHYQQQPAMGSAAKNLYEPPSFNDDIIAIRKVNVESFLDGGIPSLTPTEAHSAQPRLMPYNDEPVTLRAEPRSAPRVEPRLDCATEEVQKCTGPTVMMFLLAKENRQFAGYELLQTVLTAGLRFGEGNLFHRHQFTNGEGPVLCSLAAATATGIFDLHNIGAFSVRGLCLYMQSSTNPAIDAERFSVMLETARQLSEGLDAHLLDNRRRPLTDEHIAHYYNVLNIPHDCYEEAMA